MPRFKLTAEQYTILKEFMEARTKENWGLWPPVESWPVPPEAGGFMVSQYQVGRGSSANCVIKFDVAIALPNGKIAKRLAKGATRRLPFEITYAW